MYVIVVVFVPVRPPACVSIYLKWVERLTTIFRNFNGLYSTIREMETAMVCVFCCALCDSNGSDKKKHTQNQRTPHSFLTIKHLM